MLGSRSRLLLVILSTMLLTLAACGGDEADGGGAAVSGAPVQERVVVTPETVDTPFGLAKGTYRVTWSTTDCPSLTVVLTGDNGFSKEKSSTLPNFSWIVTSVPDGTYTIAQTESACSTWEMTVEKIG